MDTNLGMDASKESVDKVYERAAYEAGDVASEVGPDFPPDVSVEEGLDGPKRLVRDTSDSIVAGVSSGIANYFGIDPLFVRIAWVIALISGAAPGIVPYLIMWVIMPDEFGERTSLPMILLLLFVALPAAIVFAIIFIPLIFGLMAALFMASVI